MGLQAVQRLPPCGQRTAGRRARSDKGGARVAVGVAGAVAGAAGATGVERAGGVTVTATAAVVIAASHAPGVERAGCVKFTVYARMREEEPLRTATPFVSKHGKFSRTTMSG